MSQASNWLSRCSRAGPMFHGSESGGTLWISGSGKTNRARESTERMLSIAAIAARTSCRFSPAPRGVGKHQILCSSPREERNFIHRRVQRNVVGVFAMDSCRLSSKSREPVHKSRRENVEVIGPSVMEQVPDHLNAFALCGLQHGHPRAPVERACPVDEVPPQPVARGKNVQFTETAVVFGAVADALDRGGHIQADAGAVDVCRTFKVSHPKGTEEGVIGGHELSGDLHWERYIDCARDA